MLRPGGEERQADWLLAGGAMVKNVRRLVDGLPGCVAQRAPALFCLGCLLWGVRGEPNTDGHHEQAGQASGRGTEQHCAHPLFPLATGG